MAKVKIAAASRTQRWINNAERASSLLEEAIGAIEELKGVQEEYQEWLDNLPENLQQSAVGEKLEAVTDLDIETALQSIQEAQDILNEAAAADLPLGFGRD
jgi:hypothetical protein